MTPREKRCTDCICLVKKNGVMCCDELWDRPYNDIAEDECPEEITIENVEEIEDKTKNFKIEHKASSQDKKDKKPSKPRTVTIVDEKKELFNDILTNLLEKYGESVEVVKENKLITVKINDKNFKIDIIHQKKVKKD